MNVSERIWYFTNAQRKIYSDGKQFRLEPGIRFSVHKRAKSFYILPAERLDPIRPTACLLKVEDTASWSETSGFPNEGCFNGGSFEVLSIFDATPVIASYTNKVWEELKRRIEHDSLLPPAPPISYSHTHPIEYARREFTAIDRVMASNYHKWSYEDFKHYANGGSKVMGPDPDHGFNDDDISHLTIERAKYISEKADELYQKVMVESMEVKCLTGVHSITAEEVWNIFANSPAAIRKIQQADASCSVYPPGTPRSPRAMLRIGAPAEFREYRNNLLARMLQKHADDLDVTDPYFNGRVDYRDNTGFGHH